MFEIVTYAYSSLLWTTYRLYKIEGETWKTFLHPGTFLSGAVAGGVARAAVLAIDRGGTKGAAQTVGRRVPQMGFLMMFYVPVAANLLPGLEKNPFAKMCTTFLVASMAGFNMRLVTNPISRVLDEARRTGKSPQEVCRVFKSKTILQFWYTGPNLFANALYFGTMLTVFEGLRRYAERNWFPIQRNAVEETVVMQNGEVQLVETPAPEKKGTLAVVDRNFNAHNYRTTIATNFVLGGTAAAVASTVCYPYSAHRYLQTVIYDSAICRGLLPTLAKEVPMMAVFFATFSVLQPLFSSRHGTRCGFGY